MLLCADRNWFESKEECETASRSDPISAHPGELCVAQRPYSCQRSTRARARAGPLTRGVRSPPSALLLGPRAAALGTSAAQLAPLGRPGLLGAQLASLGQLGLLCRVVATTLPRIRAGPVWTCLVLVPACPCLFPVSAVPTCLCLAACDYPMHLCACAVARECVVCTPALRTRRGTPGLPGLPGIPSGLPWTWLGPGPRSVPESAVVFSLSPSAPQTPSSLSASFSAPSPARERRARDRRSLHTSLAPTFLRPPQRA